MLPTGQWLMSHMYLSKKRGFVAPGTPEMWDPVVAYVGIAILEDPTLTNIV